MTQSDKQRIENEADALARKWLEVQYTAAKTSYIKGSESQHEHHKLIGPHLQFIFDRMVNVYGENPNYDFMIKLKEIIDNLK